MDQKIQVTQVSSPKLPSSLMLVHTSCYKESGINGSQLICSTLWLLIYQIRKETNLIVLLKTGSLIGNITAFSSLCTPAIKNNLEKCCWFYTIVSLIRFPKSQTKQMTILAKAIGTNKAQLPDYLRWEVSHPHPFHQCLTFISLYPCLLCRWVAIPLVKGIIFVP